MTSALIEDEITLLPNNLRMKFLIIVHFVGADFFPKEGDEAAEVLIGKILAHFLQCIQFNMHMVDSVFR